MGRTIRRAETGDPILALGLLVVGLLSLCVAVLYPVQQLLDSSSAAGFVSDSLVIVSADTAIVVVGCLCVSAVAVSLGVVLLLVRL
jgi:hypothetical protein